MSGANLRPRWEQIRNKPDLVPNGVDVPAGIILQSGSSGVIVGDTAITLGSALVSVVGAGFIYNSSPVITASAMQAATTLYVSKRSTATDTRTGINKHDITKPFTSIQAAVTAAVTGETIVVEPGNYQIASTITVPSGKNIAIVGSVEGATQVSMSAGATYTVLLSTSSELTLKNLRLTLSQGAGIGGQVVESASVAATVYASDCTFEGIADVVRGTFASSQFYTRCIFRSQWDCVTCYLGAMEFDFCTFETTAVSVAVSDIARSIYVDNAGSVILRNCLVSVTCADAAITRVIGVGVSDEDDGGSPELIIWDSQIQTESGSSSNYGVEISKTAGAFLKLVNVGVSISGSNPYKISQGPGLEGSSTPVYVTKCLSNAANRSGISETAVFIDSSSGGTWGSITGTLSSQTDLQTALNNKLGASVTKAELNTAISDGNGVYVGDALGTPSSGTLTSCTGLPISTGVSGLGTGVGTALAIAVGSAGGPVTNGGALGTPSSGTVTNLTGTASININGTVGATTPTTIAATTATLSGSTSLVLPSTSTIQKAGSVGTGAISFQDTSAVTVFQVNYSSYNVASRAGFASTLDFRALNFSTNTLDIIRGDQIRWRSAAAGGFETGVCSYAAGVVEINNGTSGTLRDLSLRNVLQTLTTPASASATGVAGTITADANYVYVCTATNTWKRVAIATW